MVDRWRDRPTADVVVLGLTMIIGLVIVLSMVAVVVVEFKDHDRDTSGAVRAVFDITASLVTGVIGYIGGRAVGRKEGS